MRNGGWSLDAFFATGEAEISAVFDKPEAKPAKYDAALDFGCGVGRLTRALARRFERCYGIDTSHEMIEQARRLNADVGNCSFDVATLAGFDHGSIDFVYSAFVLQHLRSEREIEKLVGEFLRVVAPGGAVVFQLPERLSARERLQLRGRLFALLCRLGVSGEWLYRRARLHPVRVRGLDEAEVGSLIERSGAELTRAEVVDPTARLGGLRYFVRR